MLKQIALETQIAVIGAGPAGLSAAITAARQSKKVLLLEKNGYWAETPPLACRCWAFWILPAGGS